MTNGVVAPEIVWKRKIGGSFGFSLQQILKVMLQIRHSSLEKFVIQPASDSENPSLCSKL